MNKVLFEEKQRYAAWIGWTVAFVSIGAVAGVWYNLYQKVGWQSEWSTDNYLHAAACVLIPLIGWLNTWLVVSYNLDVVVDEEGISYSMFPMVLKQQRIQRREIAGYQIRKISFLEYSRSGGERRIRNSKKKIHLISSWTVMDLTLVNGKQIMLGTKNREGFEWAVKKITSTGS